MTASEVFFDSWAWWEVLHETPKGKALSTKYGPGSSYRVHTSVLSVAELGSKLLRRGDDTRARRMVTMIEGDSQLHPVNQVDAQSAARLHPELKKKHDRAGIADALILCAAQRLGHILISGDRAFQGRTDVTDR